MCAPVHSPALETQGAGGCFQKDNPLKSVQMSGLSRKSDVCLVCYLPSNPQQVSVLEGSFWGAGNSISKAFMETRFPWAAFSSKLPTTQQVTLYMYMDLGLMYLHSYHSGLKKGAGGGKSMAFTL